MEKAGNEKIKHSKISTERKEKVKKLFKKNLLPLIGLIILLFLAWHIRTVNLPKLKDITTGEYTLGPDADPYLFLRYAKYIVENGKLMEQDIMRNVPLGFDTAVETKLLPYMIAYFHKAISIFSGKNVAYSADVFPAFFFLLIVIAFFIFIRKVFENQKHKNLIALIASAFLIVNPSMIARTVAGIPEKESVALLFMLLTFYFFLCAWEFEKMKKALIFSFLAGLSTALMGLVWGAINFIYLPIGLAFFLAFICGKVDKKRFLLYSIWLFFSFFLLLIFHSGKYNFRNIIDAPASTGFSLAIFSLIFIHFLIFETKIKNLSFMNNLRRKIPDKLISIFAFIILYSILFIAFLGASSFLNNIKDITYTLTRTGGDRFSSTVRENQQPYFDNWKEYFGPAIKGTLLFFWLFFIGSIFFFYDTIKKIKGKYLLTFLYILFLLAFIFNIYSSKSSMKGSSAISTIFYFFGFIILISSLFYIYYSYFKKEKLRELKNINFAYLLFLSFFLISLIGARSAVRLIMILAIPAATIVGYFSVIILEKSKKQKDETLRFFLFIFTIIVVISILLSFYSHYKQTITTAKQTIPTLYHRQWQKAMSWVRDNTEKDAVFSSWWDYGYWLQAVGERATILDGGNYISYWNHLFGRHVLTGQNEKEALEFLYAHNASYLLIDSTDIGKYGAFSSIGSDEEYDRYSRVLVFEKDEKRMQETEEEIIHFYEGLMSLDQDYFYEHEGKQKLLPAYKTKIAGVFLRESKQEESKQEKIKQPNAVFVYQEKPILIPLGCLYYKEKKYDFKTGYPGCFYIIQELISYTEQGATFKKANRGLFITEKAMNSLFTKLFLFNEAENFQLVHKEQNIIIQEIEEQGTDMDDFFFGVYVHGPIKIWKINYPSDIKLKEEYLETDYPESLRIVDKSIPT